MLDRPDRPDQCQILAGGKRRDGGTKYWCLKHRADAAAKYGKRAPKCLRADFLAPTSSEIVNVDTAAYSGGIGLWGAVPRVYDTTNKAMDGGVHVHARKAPSGKKVIDRTFRQVNIVHEGNGYTIDELDAIYFMVSAVIGFSLKSMFCDKCGYWHLDKD